jgi:hypothetical protein
MSAQRVRIALPCSTRFAGVLRTAVAACGVVEGFSVDEIGDLRLLVDEVFVAMYELGVDEVELVVTADHGHLTVALAATDSAGRHRRGPADTTFAETLASVVADDVRFDLHAANPSFAASVATSLP